jgi:regulatory protein
MDLLARREHGQQELIRKLVTRGCPAALAESAVAELLAERLVSDERLVESLIATRRNQGHGPLRIRNDLREKGVAAELIDAWLDERDPEWLKVLEQVRRQKFGATLPREFTERARQARFLQSRGFTAEQIMKVVNADEPFGE